MKLPKGKPPRIWAQSSGVEDLPGTWLPDEELNCIEQADPGRLKWLDGLAGDTFEDLSKYNEEIESFRK